MEAEDHTRFFNRVVTPAEISLLINGNSATESVAKFSINPKTKVI